MKYLKQHIGFKNYETKNHETNNYRFQDQITFTLTDEELMLEMSPL